MPLTQPKKPVGGAFGVFSGEKRAEFIQACQGKKASEVAKMAGEAWKKLSDQEKAPYQKRYEEKKAQFDTDWAAFIASGGEKEKGTLAMRAEKRKKKEGKLIKKEKDPNAPKKVVGGAYGVFLDENRAEIIKSLPTGHSITDIGKAAGAQWKALSEAAKKPYQQKFEEKLAAYKAAAEEYQKSDAYEAWKESHKGKPAQAALEIGGKTRSVEKPSRGAKRGRPQKTAGTPSTAKVGRKSKAADSPKSLLSEAAVAKCMEMGVAASGVSYKTLLEKLIGSDDFANVDQEKALEALKEQGGLLNKTRNALLACSGA